MTSRDNMAFQSSIDNFELRGIQKEDELPSYDIAIEKKVTFQ